MLNIVEMGCRYLCGWSSRLCRFFSLWYHENDFGKLQNIHAFLLGSPGRDNNDSLKLKCPLLSQAPDVYPSYNHPSCSDIPGKKVQFHHALACKMAHRVLLMSNQGICSWLCSVKSHKGQDTRHGPLPMYVVDCCNR